MSLTGFLYHTLPGRLLLKPLVSKPVSDLAGVLLDTRASRLLIPLFRRVNHISTADCDLSHVRCFNDFFCRPLLPGERPFDEDPFALTAPCDGFLTAVELSGDTVLPVKQSAFTLEKLLRDPGLAKRYNGGKALIFRLTVSHYHRYSYCDSGKKSSDRRIPGVYHTVQPVALEKRPVFTENSRCYTVIRTLHFGPVVQMEVGAMLVGKIHNHMPGKSVVRRGEEKGHFLYGGSTIILLLEHDRAELLPEILAASRQGKEYAVKMGERIGLCRRN